MDAMSQPTKVRTPGSHQIHLDRPRTFPTCGCATQQNTTDPKTKTTRCPCGALYLSEIVQQHTPFTCYDCMRSVHAKP